MTVTEEQLAAAQAKVRAAEAALALARADRATLTRRAVSGGWSRYRIAQIQGLTQTAVSLDAKG